MNMTIDSHTRGKEKRRKKLEIHNAEHPPHDDSILQNAEMPVICKGKNVIDGSVKEKTMNTSNDSHARVEKKRRKNLEIHDEDPEIPITKEKRKRRDRSSYANTKHPPQNDSILQNAENICKAKSNVIDDSVMENTPMDMSNDLHASGKEKRRKNQEIHNEDPGISITKEKRKRKDKSSCANAEHPPHSDSLLQNAENVIDDPVKENAPEDMSSDSHARGKEKRRKRLEVHNEDPEISITKERRKKRDKSYVNNEDPPHNDSILQNAEILCKARNNVIDDSVKETTPMDMSCDSHTRSETKRRKRLEVHNEDPEISITKEKRKRKDKSSCANAEHVCKAKNNVIDDPVKENTPEDMPSDSHARGKEKRRKRLEVHNEDPEISITKEKRKKRDKSYVNTEDPPHNDSILQNAGILCKARNNVIDDSVKETTPMDISCDSHTRSKTKRRKRLEVHNEDPEISITKEKRKKKDKQSCANAEHVCKAKNNVIDDPVKGNTPEDLSSDSHARGKEKRRKRLEIHNEDPEISITKKKRKKRDKSSNVNTEHPPYDDSTLKNAEKVCRGKNNVIDDSVKESTPMDILNIDNSVKPRLGKRDTFKNRRKATISKEMLLGTLSDIDSDEEIQLKSLDIVVSWEPSPLHESLHRLNKADQKSFEENGIKIKSGRWTPIEEVILKDNWLNFRKEYGIKNPSYLVGLLKGRHVSKSNIKRFAQYLGQGLENRPLLSIYQQARRMLNPNSYKGGLAEEEQEELHKYRELFGHKWEAIGRLMSRTGGSLIEFMKRNHGNFNSGFWSYEEDKKLIEALTAVSGNDDLLKIHHQLRWSEVAKIVGSRNVNACRMRWIHVLSSLMCGYYEEARWTVKHTIRLIERLNEFPYEDEADVPWETMTEEFPCANCFQIKARYGQLRQKVPQGYMKTFEEIVTWLTVNHLPKLKAKLESKESQSLESDQENH